MRSAAAMDLKASAQRREAVTSHFSRRVQRRPTKPVRPIIFGGDLVSEKYVLHLAEESNTGSEKEPLSHFDKTEPENHELLEVERARWAADFWEHFETAKRGEKPMEPMITVIKLLPPSKISSSGDGRSTVENYRGVLTLRDPSGS